MRVKSFNITIDLRRMIMSGGFTLRRVITDYEKSYGIRSWKVLNHDGDFLFHIFEDEFPNRQEEKYNA